MFSEVDKKTELVGLKYDLLIKTAEIETDIKSIICDLKKLISDFKEGNIQYKVVAYGDFLKYAKENRTEKFAECLGIIEYLIQDYLSLTDARIIFDEFVADLDSYNPSKII
jgi:hypothetical protein